MSTPISPAARWPSAISQADIPANNNARRMDILLGPAISATTTAPPGSPANGDCYIIPAGASGVWSAFDIDDIVVYYDGTYIAFAPSEGLRMYVEDEGENWQFISSSSGSWAPESGGGSGVWGSITGTLSSQTDLQNALDAKGDAGIPQNSQSTGYTAVLADANKHLLHPSADTTNRTFTIPANSSVPYPIGTALTFVNQDSAGTLTISITSDIMRLAGAGTTGSRTLAANGIATALKLTSTEWIISGTNLT